METLPLVALVIPVHNGKEHTREFLNSVRKVNYHDYKVIVVDDGSTDGTTEMINQEYLEVILLRGDGNLWSSGAVNLGIEKAIALDAKYVLQIDNDTVVDPDFLASLVATGEANPNSIIIPKVYQYDEPQRLEKAGYEPHWFGTLHYPRGYGEIDRGQYDTPQELLWADTMMLIDISIIKEVGMMDAENFPMYGADNDFTARAHKRGFRILYEPGSKLWHKGHTSSKTTAKTISSWRERFAYLIRNPKSPLYWKANKTSIIRLYPIYMIPLMLALYLRNLIIKLVNSDVSV